MIRISYLAIALALLFSCQGEVKEGNAASDSEVETVETVISTKVELSQTEFDSLHLWELGKTLMVSFYETLKTNQFQDSILYAKLNEDQRHFYYFWQMDNTVSENGFLTLFPLRNATHIEEVFKGMDKWGAMDCKDLLVEVVDDFKKNEKDFIQMTIKGKGQEFAKKHDWYNRFTKKYINQHESVMQKAENYIRANPDSFVKISEELLPRTTN